MDMTSEVLTVGAAVGATAMVVARDAIAVEVSADKGCC